MRLAEWESKVRDAVRAVTDSTRAPQTLRFEKEDGGGAIAGYSCERYHVFTTRQLFPGELEDVEQEIWVTGEIRLSPAARASYRRVLESLDWIGLDAPVVRPEGVVLRTQVRRRPHGIPAGGGEDIETSEVVRVERRDASPDVFDVPPGYRPAETDRSPAETDSLP
jgi:hypothetical protein